MHFSTAIRSAILGLALACCSCLITSVAFAEDPLIFDVRRSLPLEPDEPVYHDFYISAGPEAGWKKGAYVTVVRQVPVHDPVANKQQAILNIKIGRLQIIHVERGITVARLDTEFDDDDRPTVEFESVMIGDRVDLGSITNEASEKKKKARAKAKAAAVAKEADEVVATVVPVPSLPAATAPAAASVQAPSQAPTAEHLPASVPAQISPENSKAQPSAAPSQAPVSQSQDPKSA